jgi:hypothetical protein
MAIDVFLKNLSRHALRSKVGQNVFNVFNYIIGKNPEGNISWIAAVCKHRMKSHHSKSSSHQSKSAT